jgi:GH25 family lysozyme M1 (1,4-beta-N-acetylmuramidase)
MLNSGLYVPKQKIITASAGLTPTVNARVRNFLANALALPFPPSSTDPRILLSDWSHFQGDVDIGKHLAYGPPKFRGAIIRSGQGKNSSYDDFQFQANVQKCEANNFPWMDYHVYIPAQDAEAQVVHLMNLLENLKGPLPKWIWWDVEVHNNMSKRHISNGTIYCVERTKQLSGIETGVYSARWFTSGYMELQDWFSEIIWWIAQWLYPDQPGEHPWPTVFPDTVDISQVMIHQTTSRGDGKLLGVQSTHLDLDRWMWGEERFNEIMGITPPQPPQNGDVWKQIELLWMAIEELKNGSSFDRARLEHLIQWAKTLQIAYIEAN